MPSPILYFPEAPLNICRAVNKGVQIQVMQKRLPVSYLSVAPLCKYSPLQLPCIFLLLALSIPVFKNLPPLPHLTKSLVSPSPLIYILAAIT